MKINKANQKKTAKEPDKHKPASRLPLSERQEADHKTILWGGIIIALLAFLLYANTLNHEYALDDFPVIYGNSLTMQGIKSIPTMLKTGYWFGLEGRNDFLYRPLSLITYAIEWEISPNNPPLGHVTNVLLYIVTGFLLFGFLAKLLNQYNLIIPFLTTILFIAHPIHTEVVANIKSRDELLCFLFFIVSANYFLKYASSGKFIQLILSVFCFFLSLMSKESAITFLAIYPLLFYFFTETPVKKIIVNSAYLAGAAAIYLIIRGSVIDYQTTGGNISIIDNTMAGAPDMATRHATAFYILGLYIKLLFFPHPMSSDYSYAQIPFVTFSNPLALSALIFYLFLAGYFLYRLPKKDILSFGILFYLAPITLVANIFFLTRSTMADRFLYIPSLGFCLVITTLLLKLFKMNTSTVKYPSLSGLITKNKAVCAVMGIILVPFTFKTLARNADWKNDTTLFTKDSKTSNRSSRMHFLNGNHLIQSVKQNLVSEAEKPGYLQTAAVELKEAIRIYPQNVEAIFGLGELYTQNKEYDKALECYKNAAKYNTGDGKALNNLGNTYFRMGDYKQAFETLNNAIKMYPDNPEGYNNIGSVYFITGQYQQAMEVYKKAISLNPNYPEALKNLGSCYGMLKDYNNALLYFNKGAAIDPNNPEYYNNIAITYQLMGDSLTAGTYFAKAQQIADSKRKK